MARKPKVYAADIDGLHEWVVAAPNQADALAALGVHQNLFQQGLAREAEDPTAIEAALAAPGTPLRRRKGSKSAFQPADAGGADAWADAAKAVGAKPARKKAKPTPDRSNLDRAEAELRSFEAAAKQESDALAEEEAALARRRERLADAQEAELRRLHRAIGEERRAFESRR